MVEKKAPSWARHAVRRWKELYFEIQRVDGNLDLSTPLSTIFRNEGLVTKMSALDSEKQGTPSEPIPSKKDYVTEPVTKPQKAPTIESKEKQTKRRFLYKLKELQSLLNPFTPF